MPGSKMTLKDIYCGVGFIFNGETCSDIDECLDDASNYCGNSTCNNIDGGFYCSCTDGCLMM